MRAFLQSLRLPFAAVTVSGILLGTATAFFDTGAVNIWTLFVVLLVIVSGHISANLFNDYFDHLSKNDERNENPTPLNGGSRVIQERLFEAETVLLLACLFCGLSVFLGAAFVLFHQSLFLAAFGATGLFLGFAYTAPPFKLAYRGFGEITVALAFGPFVVGGAYLAQTGHLPMLLISLPAGFLTAVILLTNSIPDRVSDELSEKRTFVVRFGTKITRHLCQDLVVFSYALIISGVLWNILPVGALGIFVSLPLAVQYFKTVKNVDQDFLPAGKAAIILEIAFTLSAAIGLVLSILFA